MEIHLLVRPMFWNFLPLLEKIMMSSMSFLNSDVVKEKTVLDVWACVIWLALQRNNLNPYRRIKLWRLYVLSKILLLYSFEQKVVIITGNTKVKKCINEEKTA